jgi:hypothetical protein
MTPTKTIYRNIRGWHVLTDPENPTLIVTARDWKTAVARDEQVLGVVITQEPEVA